MNRQPPVSISIEIPGTVDHVDQTIVSIKKTLEDEFLTYADFALELVLREALMNAVKHGNHYDAGKKVFLTLAWDKEWFFIAIRDEGDGYLYQSPNSSQMIPSDESGRGLPIIEYYADQISFNKKGNEIRIKIAIFKPEQDS